MTTIKVIMFFVGVLIVLAGLSLIMTARVETMRRAGQPVGPSEWAALIETIADLWNQIIGGVEQEYRIGLTVLAIGVVVMVLPLALPSPQKI